jgi:hypothetical protein
MMEDPVLSSATAHNQVKGNSPVSVRQGDETKLGGRVDDHILRESTHVNLSQTSPLKPFNNEITIRNGVHRVLSNRHEIKFLPQQLSVEVVWVTS